jgi:hypothetical protein
MKFSYLIFVFTCYFQIFGLAQYDTIYHPFYGDIQMIELKPNSSSNTEKGFTQVEISQFNLNHLPKYFLRDKKGQIIHTFNVFQKDIQDLKLRSTLNGDFTLKPHQLKTRNTSSYVGNDDSGYNIVYPVFSCSDIEGGKCINPKIGLIDTLGKIVLPLEFENINWIDSVFIVQNKGKYSLYSHDFKLLLSDYQLIDYINTFRDHILIKRNDKYGLVHRSGKNLLLKEYDIIRDSKYMYGRYEFLKNGLWGFVDHSFTSYLDPFSPTPNLFVRDGYFQYGKLGEKWKVIDSSGELMLECNLEMYQVISRDRFLVYKYVKDVVYERSIVDAKGTILTNEVYYDIWRVNQNTLIAGYDAKIHDDSNIKKSSKWVLLDPNGQLKKETVYKGFQIIDGDFLGAWSFNNKLRVVDENGNDVLGYEVEDVYKYSDQLYKIKVKNKHQFLDLHDPRFISKKYDQLLCVKENRIGVQSEGFWGFIDASSYREIVPPIADQVVCFQGGLACYKRDNKWIIIDSLGRKISNDLFTNVQLLENGFVKVEINGRYGVINRVGKYVVPLSYDEMKFVIQQGERSFIGVRKNGQYGIVNLRNEVVYPFIFESCAELTHHATVAHGRKDGYYAFLVITKRHTIEYYSLNFDSSKDHIKIQTNPFSGFKVFEEKCSHNSNGKCVWRGELGRYSNYTSDLCTDQGFEIQYLRNCYEKRSGAG